MKTETFEKYLKAEMNNFVRTVKEQECSTELRTAAESLLIAYDQVVDKYLEQQQPASLECEDVKQLVNLNLYQYPDDDTTLYAAGLNIDSSVKNNGIGTELLNICERICQNIYANRIYLWVEKDTWMHRWYERMGFIYLKDHEEEGYVWLSKIIPLRNNRSKDEESALLGYEKLTKIKRV